MGTLLKSAALVLCAGVSCAQASETAKQWEFNIGAMYEIENVEGQGDDKDGLYEPSVWFNATWDAWTISGNDSNLLIVFYVQIMPDDFVMQLHRF